MSLMVAKSLYLVTYDNLKAVIHTSIYSYRLETRYGYSSTIALHSLKFSRTLWPLPVLALRSQVSHTQSKISHFMSHFGASLLQVRGKNTATFSKIGFI